MSADADVELSEADVVAIEENVHVYWHPELVKQNLYRLLADRRAKVKRIAELEREVEELRGRIGLALP